MVRAPARVLFVFGTRPEAIKLAPVIRECAGRPEWFQPRVCVTAQHRALLDQVLRVFSLEPDHDLNIMRDGQSLAAVTARMLLALEEVLAAEKPAAVVVQGDTTTTFCGALAAFYQRIPVVHVEAGLRTFDLAQPFPEELNRVFTGRLAALHFPPTAAAREHLRAEGVRDEAIHVTGNTGIDALLHVRDELSAGRLAPETPFTRAAGRKLILVTTHRRESFGLGLQATVRALRRLADRSDVELAFPVHPNPNVRAVVEPLLAGLPNVHLLPPLDYVSFVGLMGQAYLAITDSGGVQEEAPSLGLPVLVLRDKTERPEAVAAGTVRLVGTVEERIVREAEALLDDPAEHARRTAVHNPYGDGQASGRIARALADFLLAE